MAHSHHHNHSGNCTHCGHEHHHTGNRNTLIRVIFALIIFIAGFLTPENFRFAVFLTAYAICGWDVLYRAVKNIFRGEVFDENFLMGIATIGAIAIKEYPEAVMVMILYQIGEMFQDYAGNKANQTTQMKEAVQFVKQKLDSAQWFIDAIKQRQETLQRTMETIILLQRDFFLTGDEATLRPMILKDVAERVGYDISTISRVSNSKYVQTNFGIYPLKYFFSESMQTDSGEEISTREVKKIMKEHVDAEDKRQPLTDEELATILKEKGYVIARRTVAKYREQLGIPVARLRKEI